MRIGIALLLFIWLPCMLAGKQQVTIRNITAKTVRYNGVSCLYFKYDAVLKNSLNQMQAAHDSGEWYKIKISFNDTGIVSASKGFRKFADSTNILTGDKNLYPYGDTKIYAGQEIYLPLAAFNLAAGNHYLNPIFSITDRWGNSIDCRFKTDTIQVQIPQQIKLLISISEIEVSKTDGHGESWDYYLFNANNARPEVCWSTVFAGTKLNGSDYTNNRFVYSDEECTDDFEFCISTGDIFYIKVFDFDITSFSDLIGSLKIDMDNYKNYGPLHTAKFNLVLNMDYSITVL